MSDPTVSIAGQVVEHLRSRRLLSADASVETVPLSGGVSNDVLAVTGPGVDVVVKHALQQLRVAEDWQANPGRIRTEGRALQVAAELLPDSVPKVFDSSNGFLVIERAPAEWRVWKQSLLEGQIDIPLARSLGEWLGQWQVATAHRADLREEFSSQSVFTDLRINPFHRTVAARHPDLAEQISDVLTAMAADRRCIVHGDFSPKNILIGPSGQSWIIDWEVVHTGDPTFDPAWIVGHLLLKSIRRRDLATEYEAAAAAFLAGRDRHAGSQVPLNPQQLARQVGCLVLSRVDGKSPVDYLDGPGRDLARSLAHALLLDTPHSVNNVWRLL